MTEYEKGEWDMFELLSGTYHGKQYYFLNDEESKTAYSRASHKTMTTEEAIEEFLVTLAEDVYRW